MDTGPIFIDALKGFAVFLLLPLAVTFFMISFRLTRVYRTDRSEYSRNRDRSSSVWKILRGELPTFYDGVRDERVAAGVALDTKKNEWVEQGKLSEEAISNVLR